MFMIAGLGNPGSAYINNRHNFGFMVLDFLQKSLSFPDFVKKPYALISQQTVQNQPFLLVKPLTFMNHSGQAIAEMARFYKIPLENIYIFHDDLEVALGRVKVKQGGGHAGHNGLRSIDHMGGKNYWRIRLGISHPGHAALVSDYVLSDFLKTEQPIVENVITSISQNFSLLVGQETNFSAKVGTLLTK